MKNYYRFSYFVRTFEIIIGIIERHESESCPEESGNCGESTVFVVESGNDWRCKALIIAVSHEEGRRLIERGNRSERTVRSDVGGRGRFGSFERAILHHLGVETTCNESRVVESMAIFASLPSPAWLISSKKIPHRRGLTSMIGACRSIFRACSIAPAAWDSCKTRKTRRTEARYMLSTCKVTSRQCACSSRD